MRTCKNVTCYSPVTLSGLQIKAELKGTLASGNSISQEANSVSHKRLTSQNTCVKTEQWTATFHEVGGCLGVWIRKVVGGSKDGSNVQMVSDSHRLTELFVPTWCSWVSRLLVFSCSSLPLRFNSTKRCWMMAQSACTSLLSCCNIANFFFIRFSPSRIRVCRLLETHSAC